MSTAAPKRVSFGSHKSMVETLIIDVDDDFLPPEERTFYQNNLCHLRHSKSSTAAELSTTDTHVHQRHSHTTKPSFKRSGSGGTVDIDNPFAVNGELRRKADYILRHSRISRSDLQIVDPDSISKPGHNEEAPASAEDETIVRQQEVPLMNASKREHTVAVSKSTIDTKRAQNTNASKVVEPTGHDCGTLNISDQPKHLPETGTIVANITDSNDDSEIKSKCDVQFTDTVHTRKISLVAVVDSVTVAKSPEWQQAEQVKLTPGKRKCCKVQ